VETYYVRAQKTEYTAKEEKVTIIKKTEKQIYR
jgi:hypothetical protein